ncbi:hypothetical protein EV421DRAFT_212171 [Armillaria borealis]|uniref:Uncharacterized protein n=1 Tax=Armillaria borealis TaxID=47425 RepID=A0AA39JRK7_9AGAR|nr:hypothetical protein EV421DRAFT_212171 [Armillaria borealis]
MTVIWFKISSKASHHSTGRPALLYPPPVYEWEEIKIIKKANSQPGCLRPTIYNYLYPWVGDSIIQGQLNVTDSIFNPESPDDYPSPQDPGLRFLLTMAGSRSIIVLPNTFCKAISNIETFFSTHHESGIRVRCYQASLRPARSRSFTTVTATYSPGFIAYSSS